MSITPYETKMRAQLRACWLGKNIGGTLGTPHEGNPGPLSLDFYSPVPDGVLPNDDLDLQLVWLYYLRASAATAVTPEILADAWKQHVRFPFDEYGYGLRNAALGITGPQRGSLDNWFGEGMGAAIRSELWACICAGDPDRAAGFAWADAVNDHAGDGVWAEVFLAALQAAAFNGGDKLQLIHDALRRLPADSATRRAIEYTILHWSQSSDWKKVRAGIIARYDNGNFTYAVLNVSFTILAWLDGEDDFGKSICLAVNCGYDTDCTGATLGALMGIHHPDCIPANWLAPIGEAIVVSPEIVGIDAPANIDELVEQTLSLAQQLSGFSPEVGAVSICQPATNNPHFQLSANFATISEEAFHSPRAPRDATFIPFVQHGHWMRIGTEDFEDNDYLAFRYRLKLKSDAPFAIMTYANSDAAVWLDDRLINRICGTTAQSHHYYSASPHRAGPYLAVMDSPEKAEYVLTVAYKLPASGKPVDTVIAVADAKTHLWLPHALVECLEHPES